MQRGEQAARDRRALPIITAIGEALATGTTGKRQEAGGTGEWRQGAEGNLPATRGRGQATPARRFQTL